MKIIYIKSILLILIVSCHSISKAQIPNADFENWSLTSDVLMPDNWTINAMGDVAIPVTRTTDSHSGTYAARGEVVSAGAPPVEILFSPIQTSVPPGSEDLGFSVSERHYVFSGFYKYYPAEGDKFQITVIMFHETTSVGIGALSIEAGAIAYTPFSIDINYTSEEIPNTCLITFTICGPTGSNDYHKGSYFIVDELEFDAPLLFFNGPGEYNYQFILQQNYPNPFDSETEINFQVPEDINVRVKIFNILGQEITELADRKFPKGRHSIRWNGRDNNGRKVSNGIYFYQIQSGDLSQARKMYLLR
jgi:hypothetical protein